MISTPREALLQRLAGFIDRKSLPHPIRVAIDGVDGAGKTVMADELAQEIERIGRPVVRGSIDGFHRPAKERFERFGESPEGYYRDSFDHESLRRCLLDPLGPKGDLRYASAVFDFRSDRALDPRWERCAPNAVLLFDGVFLLRPELRGTWDMTIFLKVSWDEVLRRVTTRDSAWMGSAMEVEDRYRKRYIPGQELYLAEAAPEDFAEIVIDNSDFSHPRVLKGAVDQ